MKNNSKKLTKKNSNNLTKKNLKNYMMKNLKNLTKKNLKNLTKTNLMETKLKKKDASYRQYQDRLMKTEIQLRKKLKNSKKKSCM